MANNKRVLHGAQKAEQEMNDFRSQYTGEILSEFAILERAIENIIAIYFTSNHELKSKELCHVLLSSEYFGFNRKTVMIRFIIDKFPTIKNKDKHIKKELKHLAGIRNALAHYTLRWNFEELKKIKNHNGEIILESLITSGNETDTIPIKLNRKIIDEELGRIKDMIYEMIEIYNVVKNG